MKLRPLSDRVVLKKAEKDAWDAAKQLREN